MVLRRLWRMVWALPVCGVVIGVPSGSHQVSVSPVFAQERAPTPPLRAQLDRRLAAIQSLAGKALTFGGSGEAAQDRLVGVWSGDQDSCRAEKIVFFVFNRRHSVEWWRRDDTIGLIPWRSGQWHLDGPTLRLTFEREGARQAETGTFAETPFTETLHIELAAATAEEVVLAAPDGAGRALLGSPRKTLVRCRI